MAKYLVILTKIYNGYVEVEADNEEDAVSQVKENMDKLVADTDFTYGETTADFVEPVNNE